MMLEQVRKRGNAIIAVAVVAAALVVVGSLSPAAASPTAAPAATASITVDSVSPGVEDSIVRLYWAVFDRAPDAGGREFWVDRYVRGLPLASIAAAFMTSDEWSATYGEVDDEAFVTLLYHNVLDRRPDRGGFDFWMHRLSSGTTRTRLLLEFSESPEFVAATGTAAPEPPPPSPFPALPADSGHGRRIVYSNSRQRVWLVETDGILADSYLVSGRRGVPSPGVFQVFSKSPKAWAGHDGITMNHMVRFARGRTLSIGFHAIPRYSNGRPLQTEDQLGTFRSAGCVRQADDKARALYEWAPIGTTVVVLR
jgi:hypothetical protein